MITKLQNIFDEEVVSSVFLDKSSVEKCMERSYNLGREEVFDWLSKMEYLSDNIQYIKEEWENQHLKK